MNVRSIVLAAGLLLVAAARAQPALDIPSADGSLTHVSWKPAGKVERWIVSLHGTGGSAKKDLEIWQRSLGGRPISILSIQWWREQGNAYLAPFDIYREIDFAASKLEIKPGTALLHGFSRGSANLYALAALDHGMGRKLFFLYVASSGGVALDYPPTRAILDGRFGQRPLAGTRWITACGAATLIPTAMAAPACAAPGNG